MKQKKQRLVYYQNQSGIVFLIFLPLKIWSNNK